MRSERKETTRFLTQFGGFSYRKWQQIRGKNKFSWVLYLNAIATFIIVHTSTTGNAFELILLTAKQREKNRNIWNFSIDFFLALKGNIYYSSSSLVRAWTGMWTTNLMLITFTYVNVFIATIVTIVYAITHYISRKTLIACIAAFKFVMFALCHTKILSWNIETSIFVRNSFFFFFRRIW